MQITIQPMPVRGVLTAPASKSVMQRACAAALLRKGETILHHYGHSQDDRAALQIIRDLGAEVTYKDDYSLSIKSGGDIATQVQHRFLHCGESGLAVRMFTPIAALDTSAIIMEGSGSLLSRPMAFFEEVLPLLGVRVESSAGLLPLKVEGPLQPCDIAIDGALSSQFLTGLLMAYSAAGAYGVGIKVSGLNSKPYIDLTLKVMNDFGMRVPQHEDYREFRFGPPAPPVALATPFEFTVEGDWSGAAFWLVAGAIAGGITVKGLDVFSPQADKKVLEALQDCGCRLSIQMDQVEVAHRPLKAFHFDATDCPDLFPPLVALAAYCSGTSVITGVHRLWHKESNRALTLQENFGQLGIEVSLQDDHMMIRGGPVQGGAVHARHDHRIAMACAIAALGAQQAVVLDGAEAVRKSYPGFYEDLAHLAPQKFDL